MSQTTREINKVTTAIISVSVRVLIYVLVIFLMYEGVTKGYGYGHEIFAPTAVAAEPGTDVQVIVDKGESVSEVGKTLKEKGLIKDELIFVIQSVIYEYDMHPGTYTMNTSMTSKEMLGLIDGNNEADEDEHS